MLSSEARQRKKVTSSATKKWKRRGKEGQLAARIFVSWERHKDKLHV